MPLPFHLGLRNNKHLVSLVRTTESNRPSLGVAYSQDSHRRSHIPTNWGVQGQGPRQSEQTDLKLPLSRRAQSILYYKVDPMVQEQINGGLSPMIHSRYEMMPGIKQRMHIGHGHADLSVRSHIAPTSSPRTRQHQSTIPASDPRRGRK